MSSSKKRSCAELKHISPAKATVTRKMVKVHVAVVADGSLAILMPKIDGRPNQEPYTNPARVAILENRGEGTTNLLLESGFFYIGTAIEDEETDRPLRTVRGYDYKYFIASMDGDFRDNAFEHLSRAAENFCEVRF